MTSAPRSGETSQVEVSGITGHGIWLFLGEREVFLSFKKFPWFRNAPISGVLHVERPQPHHLYWPDLDVDLHLDSISDPKRFPLLSRERPGPRASRPRRVTTKAVTRRPRGRRA